MMTATIEADESPQEISKAFQLFDEDKDGFVTVDDLKRIAKEVGEGSITDEELQEMISEGDHDGDGKINEEDFQKIMKKVQTYEK